MIAISPSLWFERKGNCPSCHLLVKVGTVECPHCGYRLEVYEVAAMKLKVDAQFKRTSIIGLFIFISFLIILGYFWE